MAKSKKKKKMGLSMDLVWSCIEKAPCQVTTHSGKYRWQRKSYCPAPSERAVCTCLHFFFLFPLEYCDTFSTTHNSFATKWELAAHLGWGKVLIGHKINKMLQ